MDHNAREPKWSEERNRFKKHCWNATANHVKMRYPLLNHLLRVTTLHAPQGIAQTAAAFSGRWPSLFQAVATTPKIDSDRMAGKLSGSCSLSLNHDTIYIIRMYVHITRSFFTSAPFHDTQSKSSQRRWYYTVTLYNARTCHQFMWAILRV